MAENRMIDSVDEARGSSMYYSTQAPKVVSRQFDDEIIIANFDTGIYYSLTGTAADIWLGLECCASIDEIASALASVDATQSENMAVIVTNFVETLLSEKIIMPLNRVPDRGSWVPQLSTPFSRPTLERFDDLRDLLFLDPVHDVGDAGWPMQAKNAD
jgi:hypothetical protein